MMQRNQFSCQLLNLDNIDPACAELDYICGDIRPMSAKIIMTNNFAFGGINTSLIFKKEEYRLITETEGKKWGLKKHYLSYQQ